MAKPEFALSYNRDQGRAELGELAPRPTSGTGSLARVDTFRADPAGAAGLVSRAGVRLPRQRLRSRPHDAERRPRQGNAIPINQATFLMSNMVAQAPDNNQGPWARLRELPPHAADAGERALHRLRPGGHRRHRQQRRRHRRRSPAATSPFRRTPGRSRWCCRSGGDDVSRVTARRATIAVIMPNVQGIRTTSTTGRRTSRRVDAVEALTGYNFFSNVPQAIQNAIEGGIERRQPAGRRRSVGQHERGRREDVHARRRRTRPRGALTYTILTQPVARRPDRLGRATRPTRRLPTSTAPTPSPTRQRRHAQLEHRDGDDHRPRSERPADRDRRRKSMNEDTLAHLPAVDLTANDSAGPANEAAQTLTVTSVIRDGRHARHGVADQRPGHVHADGRSTAARPASRYTGLRQRHDCRVGRSAVRDGDGRRHGQFREPSAGRVDRRAVHRQRRVADQRSPATPRTSIRASRSPSRSA